MTTPKQATKRAKRNKHDILFKDVFSHKAMVASFVRAFVDEDLVKQLRLDTLKRLSGEYVTPDGELRFSDSTWQLRRIGGRWCYVILLLEFQSTPDRVMAIRLLAYIALLLLRLERERKRRKAKVSPLPLILPIVIYTGKRPWSASTNALSLFEKAGMPIPEAFRRLLPSLEYILVDVRRIALEHPEFRDSLAAQWLRVNRADNPEERTAAVTEVARILRTAEYRELDELKRTLAQCFDYILRDERIPKNVRKVFHKDNFEEMAMTYAQGYKNWEKRVRAEGHAEGHAEGALDTLKENLREYLEDRFGATPQTVRDFLTRETDLTVLRQLTKAAWRAVSLEEFLALLDKERLAQTH